MDISIVLTRTTIFVAVYSLVLGLPFFVAFGLQDWLRGFLGEMWWLTPLILLTVLATAGPFIYLYIQRRAEEKLFQDQRRYQATLRQAATGMGRIKDMEKLVGFIVRVIMDEVGIDQCSVFLAQRDSRKYMRAESRASQKRALAADVVDLESPLIRTLMKSQQPLVYAELHQRAADNPQAKLDGVVQQMEALKAELIVPSFVDDNMIAFLVMGRKISGELYSDDDIAVFSILASQAALAIENAKYYEDIKSANERLFQAEKLAYVGTMASSIVHEIRNPLTSIKAYLDFLPRKYHEPEFKEKFDRLIPGEISRIERIVGQLLDLVRRRPVNFQPVNIVETLDATLEMLENSFQLRHIEIRRDYAGCPRVSGDPEQLKQVFMNVFMNAVQAMENGGTLTVQAGLGGAGDRVEICIADTGCGISSGQMEKLFQPFETTKKDGIGLGMTILKEIIENHKGTVVYQSECGKGTKVYITLSAVL